MSSRIDRLEEAGLEQHGGVLGYKTIDKTDWFYPADEGRIILSA
jgi:hypothetical protein